MLTSETTAGEPFDIIDFQLPDKVELYLIRQFYSRTASDSLLMTLLNGLDWQTEDLFIFGKWVRAPRLMSWHGEPEACYKYSGVYHKPKPWTEALFLLKQQIEQVCQTNFNSVLANLYRNGQDSMGCHADDEPELGTNPTIASFSVGDERLFKLHHKTSKQTLNITLRHGDLLVMGGLCQQHWLHSIPKTKKTKSPRINLTYRHIING